MTLTQIWKEEVSDLILEAGMNEPVMRISVREPASEYKMMMWIETPLTPRHEEQEINVEGYRLLLVAGEEGEHDTLITFIPKVQPTQAELLPAKSLNLRTLSALAWKYDWPFSQYLGFGGSPQLVWERKPRPQLPRVGFYDLEKLQYPPDPNAQRALAFYRQGLIQADAFFRFLGYYRVVELAAGRGGGRAQVGWIMRVLPKIKDGEVQKRLGELSHVGTVGDYLYDSGRCAVAHAGVDPRDPITNPDNPQDLDRILADMPVVKALAEYAIRFDFGVPR